MNNPNNPFLIDEPQLDYSQVENEFEVYQQGRMLRTVVHTPAWEIVIDTLKSYRDKAIADLMALAPGDPNVPTAHAAAAALDDQFGKFQQDIANAVRMADQPSLELVDYLNGVVKNSDVLRAQG